MLKTLTITKINPEAGAFILEHNTEKEDIIEGQYLFRQAFDTKEELQEARDTINAIFDPVKTKYPNSTITFVMPGRPLEEFFLQLRQGGYEIRAWCKIKP